MLCSIATRSTLDLNVIRDRSPPFVRLADGSIRNDYALKLINMAPRDRAASRSAVAGLDGAHIVVQGRRAGRRAAGSSPRPGQTASPMCGFMWSRRPARAQARIGSLRISDTETRRKRRQRVGLSCGSALHDAHSSRFELRGWHVLVGHARVLRRGDRRQRRLSP